MLVAEAVKATRELWTGLRNEVWANEIKIDVAIAWLGNELVGERGLFLNPAYDAWHEKRYGHHAAGGDWKEVADRVCAALSELAALQGRPEPDSSGPPRGDPPPSRLQRERQDVYPGDLPARHWDAEAGLRTNKGEAKLAELDPWYPEFWPPKKRKHSLK